MKSRTPDVDLRVGFFTGAIVLVGLHACSTRSGTSWPGSENGAAAASDSGPPSSAGEAPSPAGSVRPSVVNAVDGGRFSSPDARAPEESDAGSTVAVGGYPVGADKIVGIDFMHRIIGQWSGTNNSAALGIAFPMTVDFEPSGQSFIFGRYDLDSKNDVLWGFNIETYGGKDVMAFRNGGYLGGVKRDSRLQLIEYDTSIGYYRFCAVLESGVPVDGCNYIDARYTFTGPNAMTFDVMTQSGKAHVLWQATRVQSHALPDPFPASAASQGPGTAPWPADAGL